MNVSNNRKLFPSSSPTSTGTTWASDSFRHAILSSTNIMVSHNPGEFSSKKMAKLNAVNVWNPKKFGFQIAQLCPILRQPRFQTLSEIQMPLNFTYIFTSLDHYIYKCMTLNSQYDLAQCVWISDSWDCWFCSDFGHNHATSMSEILNVPILALFGFQMFRFQTFTVLEKYLSLSKTGKFVFLGWYLY